MIFRKKKFKYYGDLYDDFSESETKMERLKMHYYFFLITFFPLFILLIIRMALGYTINLAG